jgi:hypothetical protein
MISLVEMINTMLAPCQLCIERRRVDGRLRQAVDKRQRVGQPWITAMWPVKKTRDRG